MTADCGSAVSGSLDLNLKQWQSLIELFNTHKANSTEKIAGKIETPSWIIHIEASNHVTRCLDNLSDLQQTSNCLMGLLSGGHVIATKEGMIKLYKDLVLKNVLYVSGLACNLIPVSKIQMKLIVLQLFLDICVFT